MAGSITKYKEKELVSVDIAAADPSANAGAGVPAFKYGFATNIGDDEKTALGQELMDISSPPPRLIIGTSYPKPGRANIRKATYFVSSFYDVTKRIALKNAGWNVTKSRSNPRIINATSAFVATTYVTIRGIKYAWQRPKVTADIGGAADMTALGHKVPTTSDYSELCFGANFPRPPRAAKVVPGTGNDGPKRINTFYDPDSTLPTGWSPSGAAMLVL